MGSLEKEQFLQALGVISAEHLLYFLEDSSSTELLTALEIIEAVAKAIGAQITINESHVAAQRRFYSLCPKEGEDATDHELNQFQLLRGL